MSATNLEIAILGRQGNGHYVGTLSGKPVEIPACASWPNCEITLTDGTEQIRLAPDHDPDIKSFIWRAAGRGFGYAMTAIGQPSDFGGLLVLGAWHDASRDETLLISCTDAELTALEADQIAEDYPEGAARTRAILDLRAQRMREHGNG